MYPMDITPKTSHKRTVKQFDIKKYMGEWYEIARYDNIFERGLVDVSTRYTLLPDNTVKVENIGMNHHGRQKKIFGTAFQPEPLNNPAHLRVSFFWWFASDYNVIMLPDDYSYSVVSGNNGKYLWILSRNKVMDGTTLDHIFEFLRTRGFNPSKLVF